MPSQVIEGTWEEIKRHEAELIGRRLRVTIMPQKLSAKKPKTSTKNGAMPAKPKQLRGWGMLAGIISTEDYLREKRKDTLLEDRDLR